MMQEIELTYQQAETSRHNNHNSMHSFSKLCQNSITEETEEGMCYKALKYGDITIVLP